jgi:carbon-monoxide dehydrogenase large subunit
VSSAEELTFARKTWVGRPMKRVEDPRMLTGAARYVGDLQPAGTLEAAFVRSPHPHARVGAIDATAARELPGVVAVYTAADLADTVPLAHLIDLEGAARTPRPALAGTKVRYVGEPVALVVAADRYVAEDAAELVDVAWEPLEPVPSIADARAQDAPVLHEELGTNCYYASSADTGATDDAFARAAPRRLAAAAHGTAWPPRRWRRAGSSRRWTPARRS